MALSPDMLNKKIIRCKKCPRLIRYCRDVARTKRKAFQDWTYWGKPVPNFGDDAAQLVIVGLAPAAHGANRTGRMFTGDRSGDWLYRALFKAGFANKAVACDRNDGLQLLNCVITAVNHCAPPGNKPAKDEIANCSQWLKKTLDIFPTRVILALGGISWTETVKELRRREWLTELCPKFSHGVEVPLSENRWLIASYHPSQQNTFTGRLTEPMLDKVFQKAKKRLK